MQWDYRIVRHHGAKGRLWYGLHMVYYVGGVPKSYSPKPVTFSSDVGPHVIEVMLRQALSDLGTGPILDDSLDEMIGAFE